MRKIYTYQAVEQWLCSFESRIAFFNVELHEFLEGLRINKSYNGYSVKDIRKNTNIKKKASDVIGELLFKKFIVKRQNNYFIIKNHTNSYEITCSLYRFGYISHLSAMKLYRLTDKSPKDIDYTAPNRNLWKKYHCETKGDNSLILPYPSENIEINKNCIAVHSRSKLYTPNLIGENIRVVSIGELYVEMTRKPELCGGFHHILDVYKHTVKFFLEEIISFTHINGTDIDKCRVGYILNSYLHIEDYRFVEWKYKNVCRGGSRKMIYNEPYINQYSEDWNISLNYGNPSCSDEAFQNCVITHDPLTGE